jgi:hypothetical protein
MSKPSEYKHIEAWGYFLGSAAYYIDAEQRKAAEEKAPLNAIYERDGKWATFDTVKSEMRKGQIEDYINNPKKYGKV